MEIKVIIMSKKKILVIEDERDQRANTCFVLEQAGYEAIDADEGVKGLEMAKAYKPDLVICDLNLPGLTGYEVIDKIREDPEISKVPIIILSVFPMPENLDIGLRLKAQDYIVKPFNFKDLLARVKQCL
jgi:DNA-binding response OmpR family regulator